MRSKKQYIVYKLRNKINGKCYVGQSGCTLEQVLRRHCKPTGVRVIQLAIQKYGIQSFTCRIIDFATSRSVICEKEKFWIKHFACISPNGYNVTLGGDGVNIPKGKPHFNKGKKRPDLALINQSEEHKQAVSRAKKGKPNPLKGIKVGPYSKARRKAISEACKGRPAWNKGLKMGPHTKEHNKKISSGLLSSKKYRIGMKNRVWTPWNRGLHIVRKPA